MFEEKTSNEFKFSLYQGDVLLAERMFDADQFSPFTRYSIDIRDLLPKTINFLQRTLSKRMYDTCFDDDLDIYSSYKEVVNKHHYIDTWYNPKVVTYNVDDKVIRGVECKIGLYINNKPIVEREFYVDGFNPVCRWSIDIINAIDEVTDDIYRSIKLSDEKNIWDDYDLIKKMGMNIAQVRALPLYKRKEFLSRIHR